MSFLWMSTRSRPDIQKNRLAWNESWENDLAKSYRHVIIPLSSLFSQPAIPQDPKINDDSILINIQISRAICDLQQDFARRAVESLAALNFEAEWRHLPDSRRRELVLEGICRAVINGGQDMEERRKWCPDITVSGLADKQGAGFMALVKSLLPADVHSPIVEPIHVSHPIMDKVFQDEGTDRRISAMVHSMRLARTYFVSTVAWQITLAFHGVEEPAYVREPLSSVKRHASRPVADKFKPQTAAQMKRKYKEEKKLPNACWNCQKVEPSGTAFPTCGACRRNVDRYIRYCSKECQRADWKSHRPICGKVIDPDIDIPTSVQIDADELIPAPLPSFRRSPALLHQLTYLKTLPEADYAIIYPSTERHVIARRILLPSQVPGRKEFLVMRRRALRTGDPAAVRLMFESLATRAVPESFSVDRLKGQLEAEYGTNFLDTVLEKATPITAEEKEIIERSGRIRIDDHDWVL